MALDRQEGYDQVKNKIKASKEYANVKDKYDSVTKKYGDALEQKKSEITNQLNDAKKLAEGYKKEIKSQFEELLDISALTGGKGGNTIKYLKKIFLKTINKIRPEIDEIVIGELVNALGCDQQQTYTGGQAFFIKLKSIDLFSSLKIDPEDTVGKIFYERLPVTIQTVPFSLNKELYYRIQSGQPYSIDNGQLYLGASGQPLFDIQYFDVNPITGVPGGWFKITLQNRIDGINKVIEFMRDYYKSIKIFDIHSVIAGIIDAISGAVSIEADYGLQQNTETTTFSLYIQRILGLCFDNAKEIDVSGVSKLDELDSIDDSFFELTNLDLRKIENKVSNIMNGVVEFESCDNVKLPVNATQIANALADLTFIENEIDIAAAGDNITNILVANPQWGGFQFDAEIKAAIDFDFIKLIINGILRAILTPKIILPLITMFKAIAAAGADLIADSIEKLKDFMVKFKKLVINMISKIGALFVRELFEIIKKDLFSLIQQIVVDLAREKADKKLIIILKLTQLLIVVAEFIKDWRRCKSVIDELLKLLTIATTGFGFEIPSPLLALSQFLDGYSATRAFMGTIEEMQKMGIPTGDMPDGGPNFNIISKFGELKAQAKESAESGKLEGIALPGKVFPNGTTGGLKVTGKSM